MAPRRPRAPSRTPCRSITSAPAAAVDGLDKVWNTWLHPARRVVVGQLESPAQERLFFYLFPRHRPDEAQAGRVGRRVAS